MNIARYKKLPPTYRYAFIVAGVDCQPWLFKSLNSILEQEYENYVVHVVDDATDDSAYRFEIAAYCEKLGWQYTLNDTRMGAVYNQVHAIRALNLEPDDVIVWCDADDRLAHPNVLDILNSYYHRGVDMTYGSYISEPHSPTCAPARAYPDKVRRTGDYRKFAFEDGGGIWFNHLRTMKHKLFAAMDDSDFKDKRGHWLTACTDTAIMIPGLELSGGNWAFVPETLYIYNSENPYSDWRRQPRQVDNGHGWILKPFRKKQPLKA